MFRKRTNMRWWVQQIDWEPLLFKLIREAMEGNHWETLSDLTALSYTPLSRLDGICYMDNVCFFFGGWGELETTTYIHPSRNPSSSHLNIRNIPA